MTIKEAHHTECHIEYNISDQQLLNGILQLLYLRFQLASLVCCYRTCNYRSRNSACSAKSLLWRDKYIRHILIFSQQGKMEKNLKRLSVCSHHYKLGNPSIQRLSSFIRTLLELLVVSSLLNKIKRLKQARVYRRRRGRPTGNARAARGVGNNGSILGWHRKGFNSFVSGTMMSAA